MKAFIVNRVGDFGFALGIFLCFWLFGSVDFDADFPRAPDSGQDAVHFIGFEWNALTRWQACCCSWARWANRRSSCSTPGCRTRWKVRPLSPR
jgi:hypothetical protein